MTAGAEVAAARPWWQRDDLGYRDGRLHFAGRDVLDLAQAAGGPLYVHRLLSRRPSIDASQGERAGPVGERNSYALRPRGAILCVASDAAELKAQQALVQATGNRVAASETEDIAAALFAGNAEELLALTRRMAERPGRIVPVHVAPYPRELLSDEVSLSVNTAAAGGNASLMAVG